MLKDKFLAAGYLDNNYLQLYIELVNTDFSNFAGYKEKHHVIPVCQYKITNNLTTRNEAELIANADSDNIIISLPYAEHVKAHGYLYNCTTGKIKFLNRQAFMMMLEDTPVANMIRELTSEEYALVQQGKEQMQAESDYRWNTTDKIWLKENYKQYSRNKCAEILGYSETSVGLMAYRLGLTKKQDAGFDWQDDFIKQNYWSMSVKELSDRIEHTVTQTYKRLTYLGLSKKGTDEKLSELKYLYFEGKTIEELSTIFKKSKKAIKGQINQYGWAKLK